MRIPALALAQRALLLDARGHTAYVMRGLLVALMLLALWTAHEWGRFMGAPGLHLFSWVINTNFWFVTLFGVSTFSAVVAEEKENMTLGLLKMAGFGAASILIGKSIGQLLTMLLLLLVQLPFALLAITLGGVSQHQILAAYVLLCAHVLFVYGLALLCSVLASRSGLAARMTGLSLLGYYLLPWLCLSAFSGGRGSQAAGGGDNALLAGVLWVAQNSAWIGINATTTTGFDEPLFGTPALLTLAMAGILYALAAAAFGPCTRHEIAAAPAREIAHVDLDVAGEPDVRGGCRGRSRAAQHGLDAQHQLRNRERLRDVVVGAERQTVHDVLVAGLRRKHDDADVAIDLAYLVADREPVAARQHHVEQQQVVLARQPLAKPFAAFADGIDVVAVIDEHVREAVTNGGLVLDDEYAWLRALHQWCQG